MEQGVSIIICSHNGELRVPTTLSHLRAQIPPRIPWEVVLIDNASEDDTAKVAVSCWADGPVPLRVVNEAKLGLQHARERGLREAKYDFLGFVDDDNWVAQDWVLVAHDTLASDPALGAEGSVCNPVFELPEPKWFRVFHSSYAILTDSDLVQYREPEYLSGAGLCLRKYAWTQLIQQGFRSLMTDRFGTQLSGGGDTELTSAIRLAGWKIRVEPRLRLKHFMPAERLTWSYLRRLQRGYTASQVLLDAYSTHNVSMTLGFKQWLGHIWWCQLASSLLKVVRRPNALFATLTSSGEHRQDVIEIEMLYGRILGMLHVRGRYGTLRRHVRLAPWRLRRPEESTSPRYRTSV
jgi:glycosyltransferase involved in cell wall biosynthesis